MRDLLESLTGKGLSSTAKLIAILEASGVVDRAEIERITECKASTVRENVRALRIAGNPSPESDGNPSAMEIQRQKSITSDGNPSHRQKSSAGNPSNDVQRWNSIASPARGVVPNPTTVEVGNTLTKSPTPIPPYSPPLVPSPSRKCDPDGVTWDANSKTILLDDGNRAFWLDLFEGDAARLDLALIEAAGSIQPNSRQLLALQVGRSLSRIVADRKDRDRRYANAAAAKQASPAQPRMDLNTRKAAEVAELRRRMKAREEAANAAHH